MSDLIMVGMKGYRSAEYRDAGGWRVRVLDERGALTTMFNEDRTESRDEMFETQQRVEVVWRRLVKAKGRRVELPKGWAWLDDEHTARLVFGFGLDQ